MDYRLEYEKMRKRLRRQFLRDLLEHRASEMLTAAQINEYYCYDFVERDVNFVCFRLYPGNAAAEKLAGNLAADTDARFKNTFHESETLAFGCRGVSVINITDDNNAPFEFAFRREMRTAFEHIRSSAQEAGYLAVISEGAVTGDFGRLGECLDSAVMGLDFRFSSGSSRVYDLNDIPWQIPDISEILTDKTVFEIKYRCMLSDCSSLLALCNRIYTDNQYRFKRSPGLVTQLAKAIFKLCLVNLYPDDDRGELSMADVYSEKNNSMLYASDVLMNLRAAVSELFSRRRERCDGSHYAVAAAKEYILKHFDEAIQLPDIAAHVSLTPAYLSVIFKQHAGISATDYIASVRLEHAVELLHGTALPISEVARLSGYGDPRYFSRVFKKHLGASPSDFRAKACFDPDSSVQS